MAGPWEDFEPSTGKAAAPVAQQAAAPSGPWNDFAQPASKPKVGIFEAFKDDLEAGLQKTSRNILAAAGSPLLLMDKGLSAVGLPETGAAEWYANNVFALPQGRIDFLQDKQKATERGTAQTVAGAGGSVVSMIPDMVMGAPLQRAVQPAVTAATPTVTSAIQRMMTEGVAGAQPLAANYGVNKFAEAKELGASDMTAAKAGLAGYQNMTMQGALPAGMPGSVAKRVATGATVNPLLGGIGQMYENAAVPEMPKLQRDPLDIADRGTDALVGMVMHAILGGRAPRIQTARDVENIRGRHNADVWGIDRTDGYGPVLEEMTPPDQAQQAAAQDVFARPLKDATAEMNSRLFPEPTGEVPDLSLIDPQRGPVRYDSRTNHDPAAIPNRAGLTLEGEGPNRVLADSDLRNIQNILGLDEPTVLAMPRHAQEALRDHANQFSEATGAFDVAARRQRQADADMANRGELAQDYQASGAAASGGEFDSGVRRVTLLDKQQPIEVLGNDGKIADIRYQDRNGEWHRMQVESKRVSEHDIPQNQRLAQDFRERAVEPTDKNGDPVPGYLRDTLNDEGSPRVATDRITGDQRSGRTTPYNPNEINRGPVEGTVERPGEGGLPPPKDGPRREGQTYDNEPPMQPPVRRAPADVATQPAEKGASDGQGQKAEVLTLTEPVKDAPAPELPPRAEPSKPAAAETAAEPAPTVVSSKMVGRGTGETHHVVTLSDGRVLRMYKSDPGSDHGLGAWHLDTFETHGSIPSWATNQSSSRWRSDVLGYTKAEALQNIVKVADRFKEWELQKGREAAEQEAAGRQQPKADEGPDPWLTHENKPQQAPDSQDIIDAKKLGKKKVEIDGKKVVAAEKLEELDARRNSLRELIDCLAR